MTAFAGAAFKGLLVICDAVLFVIVLNRTSYGLLRQNRAMELMGGQSVQRLGDSLIGKLKRL